MWRRGTMYPAHQVRQVFKAHNPGGQCDECEGFCLHADPLWEARELVSTLTDASARTPGIQAKARDLLPRLDAALAKRQEQSARHEAPTPGATTVNPLRQGAQPDEQDTPPNSAT
jgi:hypothetical protein